METRKSRILRIVVLAVVMCAVIVMVAVVLRVLEGVQLNEIQPQLAEPRVLKAVDPFDLCPDSVKKEYEKELKEAESCIEGGGWDVSKMEAYLSLAGWVIKDANIPEEAKSVILKDLFEKGRAIRLRGYTKASHINLVNALSSAHRGSSFTMENRLRDYKFCCSKVGLEPDEEKIRKVKEILSASLIEKQSLKN